MISQKKILDERIINMQNKIYREVFIFITIICFASIAVKFLTIGREFNLIVTEFLILILSGVYYQYRSVKTGLFSDEVEISNANHKFKYSTRTLMIVAMIGILIGLMFGLNSAINYADTTSQAIYYFFLVFFGSLVFYIPVLLLVLFVPYVILKIQSDKINKKMLQELDDGE